MRKVPYILIWLLFTNLFVYSQSGWFQQSPLPTGNILTSASFLNINTGYLCGYNKTIIKTNNSGINWIVLNCNVSTNYNSVFFNNFNTGYCAGDYGKIVKTTDGGNTWTTLNTGVAINLKSIYFINLNTGYVAGDSVLMRTTDQGYTWVNSRSNILDQCTFSCVYFINSNTGFAGGSFLLSHLQVIYKTSDAGSTWNRTTFGTDDTRTICFVNNLTGYIRGSGNIYKSTNTGDNWISVNTPLNCGILYSLDFINEYTGYLVSNLTKSQIFQTTDAATTWSQEFSDSLSYLWNIKILDSNNVISTGWAEILGTTNKGLNWNLKSSGTFENLLSVYFKNSLTGFAVGFETGMLKTTNGGTNWDWQNIVFNNNSFKYISFINDSVGYALGYPNNSTNFLIKTCDGGNNWTALNSPSTNSYFNQFSFINENTGYISADNGLIFKTTDGTNSWNIQTTNLNNNLYAIKFLDNYTGFTSGANGSILKTTNGGSNWLIVNSGTTKDLMYICLTDNITGFICGQIYGGVILKTTNTGNNWRIVFDQNDVSTNFRSICFPTTNIGYAIGNRVFKTTDIGESWFQQITPNLESLNSVYFTNANTGYVVGTNGTIFKTTDGGGPIGIKPISNKIPANFVLYQNYPNPFNPTTKIKYSIPSNVKSETSNVKLIIYDILGREVETLVNEKLQPGTYEVEWSATGGGSNYASGVYFYKLTASDPESSSGLYFVQSRKMVLVK